MDNLEILITAYSDIGTVMLKRTKIWHNEVFDILPVIRAIYAFEPYKSKGRINSRNYPTHVQVRGSEKSAKELYGKVDGFDLFDNFVPFGSRGIHTIQSVEIFSMKNGVKKYMYGPLTLNKAGYKWITSSKTYFV